MKRVTLAAATGVTTVLSIGALTATAYAWHPAGTINKSVQDQTTSSANVDANDATTALIVNSGDTLVYTVTVGNNGAAASNGNNDMAKTVVTDTLPAGLQLVGTAPNTNLGTLKPGQSMTVKYTVKVTSTKDGDVITNKACFTGNSTAGDAPQSGCDTAVVKVHVPPTPPVVPPSTPQPPVLPDTGTTALSAGLFVTAATLLGYALNALRLKLHSNA
jgi:uncharacterized repeat protein (TIGR01451 family)